MAKLFDVLPSTFFSILASPNRVIYLDCLFIIYDSIDTIEDAFQGEREYVVGKLIDYFDDNRPNFDEHEDATTSRQKAVAVINTLKQNGWLGEEELGDYKTSLNLFDYSIKVLETLKQIAQKTQLEYTGEIFAIYSLLNAFDVKEGVGILEQSYQKTKDLLSKLKALKANIYRYYYDITEKTAKDQLQLLLEKLLIDYKQNFFDSAYYNLKTTDSLPKYKRTILDKLSAIYNNEVELENLVNEVMLVKKIDDYNEAFDYVETTIRYIQECFEGLDLLVLAIDKKNEQYIHAVTSKIMFLTNHSDDLEGILNRLFKILLSEQKIDYTKLFNLVGIRNLDTESLYSPRRIRVEPYYEEIAERAEIDDEVLAQKIAVLTRNNKYSKAEINNYVKELLDGKTSLNANQISVSTTEEFVKLILIYLYSKSIGMSYDIDKLNHDVNVNGITFKNFMIYRKGV